MTLTPAERTFVERNRVGRLATVDETGRPHAVPICYALVDDFLVSPIDAKPKRVAASELARVRNIEANPRVAVLVDRYVEDWSRLAWVRIDGAASVIDLTAANHADAVGALREKYAQYEHHPLAERPVIAIEIQRATSWGALDDPTD